MSHRKARLSEVWRVISPPLNRTVTEVGSLPVKDKYRLPNRGKAVKERGGGRVGFSCDQEKKLGWGNAPLEGGVQCAHDLALGGYFRPGSIGTPRLVVDDDGVVNAANQALVRNIGLDNCTQMERPFMLCRAEE